MKKTSLTGEVGQEFYFYLRDGRVIRSVHELVESLTNMDDSVFAHHVNSERNDFANWIGDVYGNKSLATKVRKCKDRESTAQCIIDATMPKVKARKSTSSKKKERKVKKVDIPFAKKENILGLLRN